MFASSTASQSIEISDRDRTMGCWLGKAVGGTLGMPFEGVDGPLDLSFYEPVPTEMLPNDDLDLQVVWACVLSEMASPKVDRHVLASAWQRHVHFPWDEYGVALRNMANGLRPPLSGSHDNWFAHSMGATIRSEIWACLAPGEPELAAAYAYEDACVDHSGEGIFGEVFFAALQSLAFVETDRDVLLDQALAVLPTESLVRLAVEDTRKWWEELQDWRIVRTQILEHHGHENFTDAPMNVAFTVLGWLAGEGDFGRSICIAVNCGKDTDCTGATLGALLGILDPDCIPEAWLHPIGTDLVLSPGIVELSAPASLEAFTDLVLSLRERLDSNKPEAETSSQSTDHLELEVGFGYASEATAATSDFRSMKLAGTYTNWPDADFEDDWLILKYSLKLERDQTVSVMFNSPQRCRVWVDGTLLFEREGGVMSPSFHRAPPGQLGKISLTAGQHEIVAAMRRDEQGRDCQWVIGVGNPETNQWLLPSEGKLG